jgi:3-oxoacyl-(acyl-carrier-protein) synthase
MKNNQVDRIVITGFGVRVPGANTINDFKNMLENGVHGLEIRNDLTPNGEDLVTGIVKDKNMLDSKYSKHPRVAVLAVEVAKDAAKMANLDDVDKNNVGVFFGTAVGGYQNYKEVFEPFLNDNLKGVPIHAHTLMNVSSVGAAVSSELKSKGVTKTVSTSCASGLSALEDAVCYIESGRIDRAVVGGCESTIDPMQFHVFARTRSIRIPQDFSNAGSPFNKNSKGTCVTEGAGCIVIERESLAKSRGAKIYGVVDTIYSNNDAISIYSSDPEGKQMIDLVNKTLNGRLPQFINSQALGRSASDKVEKIISEMFNHKVPLYSIKGHIGHPFGASGIIQIISSLIGFEYDFIPATIRTDKFGFEEVNLVIKKMECKVKNTLVTCQGYGGINICTFLEKY